MFNRYTLKELLAEYDLNENKKDSEGHMHGNDGKFTSGGGQAKSAPKKKEVSPAHPSDAKDPEMPNTFGKSKANSKKVDKLTQKRDKIKAELDKEKSKLKTAPVNPLQAQDSPPEPPTKPSKPVKKEKGTSTKPKEKWRPNTDVNHPATSEMPKEKPSPKKEPTKPKPLENPDLSKQKAEKEQSKKNKDRIEHGRHLIDTGKELGNKLKDHFSSISDKIKELSKHDNEVF